MIFGIIAERTKVQFLMRSAIRQEVLIISSAHAYPRNSFALVEEGEIFLR